MRVEDPVGSSPSSGRRRVSASWGAACCTAVVTMARCKQKLTPSSPLRITRRMGKAAAAALVLLVAATVAFVLLAPGPLRLRASAVAPRWGGGGRTGDLKYPEGEWPADDGAMHNKHFPERCVVTCQRFGADQQRKT